VPEQQPHLSLKNILLATVFSKSSEATLPYALGLARRYASTILVAHVISPEAEKAISPEAMPTGFDEAHDFAERAMAGFRDCPHSAVCRMKGSRTKVLLPKRSARWSGTARLAWS